MPVPTEPCYRWWQATPDAEPQVVAAGAVVMSVRRDPGGGAWGERIPDSDTLKAMREMTAHDPIAGMGMAEAEGCIYCGAEPRLVGQTKSDDGRVTESRYVLHHAPNCPWLRSQEKPDDAT